MTFDLEAARAGIAHYRIENPSNVDTESALKELVDQANLAEEYLAEIERLREGAIKGNQFVNELMANCNSLRERVWKADARIKELEGMLSIRTEELDIAHSVARSEKEMHEKELAAFARRIKELEAQCEDLMQNCNSLRERAWKAEVRIKELEDALVEGLTNFLHYRASCYDPARRCPYAKECDDCSTWDACGHVEKFRSEARQQLQAEGKIGPDAKPRSWQITDERKATLSASLKVLERLKKNNTDTDHSYLDWGITVLRAMLEAGQ